MRTAVLLALLVGSCLSTARAADAAPAPEWPRKGDTVYLDMLFFATNYLPSRTDAPPWERMLLPCSAPLTVVRVAPEPREMYLNDKDPDSRRKLRWDFATTGSPKYVTLSVTADSLDRAFRTEAECMAHRDAQGENVPPQQ